MLFPPSSLFLPVSSILISAGNSNNGGYPSETLLSPKLKGPSLWNFLFFNCLEPKPLLPFKKKNAPASLLDHQTQQFRVLDFPRHTQLRRTTRLLYWNLRFVDPLLVSAPMTWMTSMKSLVHTNRDPGLRRMSRTCCQNLSSSTLHLFYRHQQQLRHVKSLESICLPMRTHFHLPQTSI